MSNLFRGARGTVTARMTAVTLLLFVAAVSSWGGESRAVSSPLIQKSAGSAGAGERPSSSSQPLILRALITAAPGRRAEVLSPATGILFAATEPARSVGDRVAAQEPVGILEHHYNYHDYSHLYTERWPLLSASLAAKRELTEAELMTERARFMFHSGQPPSASEAANATSETASAQLLWWLGELQAAETRLQVAKAAFQGAEARLLRHDAQIAKSDLSRSPLLAPISGVITEARFEQGQLIYEGAKIYSILDISTVWVRAEVAEADLQRLKETGQAAIQTIAFPGQTFPAKLIQVAPVMEKERLLEVFYEVSNPDERLKVGMLAQLVAGEAK